MVLFFFAILFSFSLAITCPDSLVDGFASAAGGTTGGGTSPAVIVTTAADLITAVAAPGSGTIIIDGTIDTGGAVSVQSDKTIQGANASATIVGGFDLRNASNVIIQNLNIHVVGAVDGIASRNSSHVWYDHLNIWDASDGLLDITIESDYQTVSWCRFWYSNSSLNHRLASLVGSGGGDHPEDEGKLHVTYHHNWWEKNIQERMPRLMYGEAHIYNNYYTSSGNNYAVGFGSYGSVSIQNNYFKGMKDPHKFLYDVYAYAGDSGNVYENTTGLRDSGKKGSKDVAGQEGFKYDPVLPPYPFTLNVASDVPELVQTCTGPRKMS